MRPLLRLLLPMLPLACAGPWLASKYRKPLPILAPLSDAEVYRLIRFSRAPPVATLVSVSFDLSADYDLGQQAFGTDGACTQAWRSVNAERWFGKDVVLADLFASAMGSHGFPVGARGELAVAARVTAAVCNSCSPRSGERQRILGDAYLQIAWVAMAVPSGKVLFTGATEGSTYRATQAKDTNGLIRAAFADAVHRLALDERYAAAVAPPAPAVATR